MFSVKRNPQFKAVIRAIKNSINLFHRAAGRAVVIVIVVNRPRCDAPFLFFAPPPLGVSSPTVVYRSV